jgi:hypothetical protein
VDIGDIDAAYLDPRERCELLADRAEWSKHAMGAEIPPRNFSQIERGLEQALHNFAHNEVNSLANALTQSDMSSQAITEAKEGKSTSNPLRSMLIEVYAKGIADALETDLQPMVGSKLITRMSKHSTNPAENRQSRRH